MTMQAVFINDINFVGDHTEQNASNDQEKGESDNKGQNAEESAGDVYSEDYFSSGSEDEHLVGGQGSKSKERRKMLTNDELLYDPDMDDEDEKWVLKQRQEHRMKGMLYEKITKPFTPEEAPTDIRHLALDTVKLIHCKSHRGGGGGDVHLPPMWPGFDPQTRRHVG